MLLVGAQIVLAMVPIAPEGSTGTVAQAQTSGITPHPDSRPGDDATRIDMHVPAVILAEPASEVALTVDLGTPDRIPRNTLLRVRGLPSTAALSEGHAIAPGSWAVPTASLPRLRIIVPAGTTGKTDVTLILVTIDGRVLAEAKTALVVGSAARLITPDMPADPRAAATLPPAQLAPPPPVPPTAPPAPATTAAPPPPLVKPAASPPALAPIPAPTPPPAQAAAAVTPPPPSPPRAPDATPSRPDVAARSIPILTAEARARAQALVQRGETLRREGDIASARLFFERAADADLAEGALALGATYDPHELALLKVHGLRPDPATARRWYERARELGHTEAVTRLTRLGP